MTNELRALLELMAVEYAVFGPLAREAGSVAQRADIERIIAAAAGADKDAGGLHWIYSAGTDGDEHRAPVNSETLARQMDRLVRTMNPGIPDNYETGFVFISRGAADRNISLEFDHPNIKFYMRLHIDPGDEGDADEVRLTLPRLPRYILAGEAEPLLLIGSDLETPGNIAAVVATGQSLLPETRETFRDIYGVDVFEMYWTAEAGPVAAECPAHDGLHVLEPDVWVEVTDDYFRPADDFKFGRLLITSRLNSVYPVVRYYAGDQGRLSRKPCMCGNDAPRILELSPAFPDLFNFRGGEIIPTELARLLAKLPLLQYQIAQKDDGVHFIYSTLADEKEVETRASNIIKTVFSAEMPVTLEADIQLGFERKLYRITAARTHDQFPVSIMRMNGTDGVDYARLMESLNHTLRTRPGTLRGGARVLIVRSSEGAGGDRARSFAAYIEEWARNAGCACMEAPRSVATLEETIKSAAADVVLNIGIFDPEAKPFAGAAAQLAAFGGLDSASEKDIEKFLKFLGTTPSPILNIFQVGGAATPVNGVADPQHVAASWSVLSLDRILAEAAGARVCDVPVLARAVDEGYYAARLDNIRLTGIQPEAARKPVAMTPADDGAAHIVWYGPYCNLCGDCATVCPESCIKLGDGEVSCSPEKCMRCYSCVDACARGALSPAFNADAVITGVGLTERAGFLAGLLSGGAEMPAYFLPRSGAVDKTQLKKDGAKAGGRPLYILGLAITTMQENAAVLLRDGEIVGAAEEERFRRVKHYGWHPAGRPGVSVSNDPKIRLEQAFCWNAVDYLLKLENITLDDVDFIAVNGIPYRFWPTYTTETTEIAMGIVRSGKLIFVPHHLAHAASAYRASGFKKAGVLTVDGRGDRITAAFFEGDGASLETVFELPVMSECSIGGGYETITHVLGLGAHGQGSTMALAALGRPEFDMNDCYSLERHDDCSVDMIEMYGRFGGLARSRRDPLLQEHKNLAASTQKALEEICMNLIREGVGVASGGNLCLAGGVALNCSMNQKIRLGFRPGDMYVQPAAHDAGTALGAALEAHRFVTGEAPAARMQDACLGPEYSRAEIRAALEGSGLAFTESGDIAGDCAELVADGKIVCWRQGRLEFGPRALGGSSILADPARKQTHKRLNAMKSRELWRPFGPSILKGRESDFFDAAFYSPFMLFTFHVKKDKRKLIPVVVHADGTTRPQSVDKSINPLFYSLIEKFEKLTSVPMVVNTSFNTGSEPIACSPEDALRNFTRLEADYLAIGDFLVENKLRKGAAGGRKRASKTKNTAAAPETSTPRRLHLRLGTYCDNNCAHCTISDIREWPARTTEAAVFEIAAGWEAGCTELVFMRGEPALRKDLAQLAGAARELGFSHVQIQTNGRRLADAGYLDSLVGAGVSFFEISLYADVEDVHDDIAGAAAFAETAQGIRNVAARGLQSIVTVPVLRKNFLRLTKIVAFLNEAGVKAVQFNFPRPVMARGKWRTETIARLSECSAHVRKAVREARMLAMAATTEGIPLCHLRGVETGGAGEKDAWSRHRVADLNFVHDDFAAHREETRPLQPLCSDCAHAGICPSTWKAYLDIYGDYELKPEVLGQI